ncbi:MAG: hypothetical protein M0R02_02955 [Bacteroidales bacterium]|nr:hypothetical protein [Bacteroidales bacterium]NLK81398.1 hypothetical protein [Bacteroidales bacterium]
MKHKVYKISIIILCICNSFLLHAQTNIDTNIEDISVNNLSENPQAMQYFMKAENFFTKNSYKKAAKFYKRAYDSDTNFVIALDNLALSYRRLYKMDSAVVYYNKSLEKNEQNKTVLNNLGLVYTYIEQYDNAIAIYNTLFKYYPNDPQGNYNMALTYYYAQNYEQAIVYGKAAFDGWKHNDKTNALEAVYLVCKIYVESDDIDGAKLFYREAAKQGMRNAKALRDFGL